MDALFANTRYKAKEELWKDIDETISFYPGLTTCRFNLGEFMEIGLYGTITLPVPTADANWDEFDCPFLIRIPSEFPAVAPIVHYRLPPNVEMRDSKYVNKNGEIKSSAIKWTPKRHPLQNYVTTITNQLSNAPPCTIEEMRNWTAALEGKPAVVPSKPSAQQKPPESKTKKGVTDEQRKYKQAMDEPGVLLADGKITPDEYARRLRTAAKEYFIRVIAPTFE